MINGETKGSNTLNEFNDELANLSSDNQYITFRIGDENYGIDIMLVQEIIRYNKLTKVFNSNPIIKGVTNFRGQVIPIIDMHRKFNLLELEYDSFTVIIVIEVSGKTMGMIVDRVSDIVSFEPEDIQEADEEFSGDVQVEHIKGMAKAENGIVLLLNPDKVLSHQELKQIDKISTEKEPEMTTD